MQDHITDKTIVIKPVDGEVTGETLETLKQKMKCVLVKCKKKKKENEEELYDYLFVKIPHFSRFYLHNNVTSTTVISTNGIATERISAYLSYTDQH